ncbi:chemotaxis protein [Desulfovibrio sp. 86]|jgi:two-component system chemotaxis response regulator CheV|uniref:Response regulator receiver modulated CheW protein n=1 Tax=uncultured Desulfovibrio sp. TaxID=167968 RepID=A0A212L503_9BACT|nr:chemotaxis protein [Desulfovibrio sp. 86]SCM72610.1 Response regulator receiver modulated CheW protein [uncultured Desulfovibrio sp.]VZH33631.1 Response regulator receiver modulated CheW protein [Desulfovibrio sp. 86]
MAQTNILLETGTNELEIVEFYVNQDGYEAHYGLNVAKVVEIGRRQPVTAMPEMRHKALLGAFLHRNGRIVPLIDMARFLGSAPITNEDAKVIVTEFNGVCTGFLVSGVNRIYRLSWTDVEAPGQFLQNMSRSSVTGVVRLEERVIFLLDLEAIVAELHPAMALRFDAADMAASDGKTYTILHVDDSSSIRSLLLDLLNKEGRFKVEQRVNGQEAWDYLQTVRNRCEAENRPVSDFLQGIITDIEMPAMDGLALCKRIKDDPVLKKLPVAIFSSMINESLARKCALVGADAQYTKPDLKALSVKLHELITAVWGHQA